ncbi:AAA family ATPase [Microbacterium sp. F51-2R]|uniref:AAA family ATPase n=1 Tax=Microbacterium sp. F51-2R TaxID=3445777 RepID=UPI003FA15EA9
MTLTTRKPTGMPSWPILLLAGREKAGKTWAAITASTSPLIGRTLYIGIGEDDPDEYALIPGADFDIVVHDGTYPGILDAIQAAVAEPVGEKPTLIIVDSMTRLWNLISDNMQEIANRRAKGRRNSNGDYTVSTDLWNTAATQWQDVMDALRLHNGPVIVTARLDSVAVMENGQPTTQKEWKVQAHKSLVFDASAIIEMRERGKFLITGVKSARIQLDAPKAFPDFTVDRLWADLGLSDGTGERTHATVHADRTGAEPASTQERVAKAATLIAAATDSAALDKLEDLAKTRGIAGIAEVKAALESKRAELGSSLTDHWATQES